MKIGIRISVCVMMLAIALTMVVFTVADFRDTGREGYILGEYDGLIAVYRMGEKGEPVSVTDIELGSLRAADRESIMQGMGAFDEKELLELLEDLGS